ncbi:MAG: DNA adenine methylase [Microcoleus sp.]
MKTPLSYYGGKGRIANQIVQYIHEISHAVYSEPFCGGLSVLYAKGEYDRGNSDYYREAINDSNNNLITFWRVARTHPEKLAEWIELTPYSQEEYRRSLEIYRTPSDYTDLEIAWAVFIQCNMSFANGIGKGWATQTLSENSAATWANRKSRLPKCFERLEKVHIGCEDALSFIDRWDSPQTLHYIDPPYPSTDQGHFKGYTLKDYQALCDKLDESEGSYILSNYYQEIEPKSAQKCVEIQATMSAANGNDREKLNTKRIEKLWICDRSLGMRQDIGKIVNIEDKSRIIQCSLF